MQIIDPVADLTKPKQLLLRIKQGTVFEMLESTKELGQEKQTRNINLANYAEVQSSAKKIFVSRQKDSDRVGSNQFESAVSYILKLQALSINSNLINALTHQWSDKVLSVKL